MNAYSPDLMKTPIAHAIDQFELWLKDQSLPMWLTQGFNQDGSAVERFLANGNADLCTDKRVRVQARQLFSLAYWQQQGWVDNADKLSHGVAHFMTTHCFNDSTNTFVFRLSADNHVVDDRCDLYDHAFHLLACAWRYSVFRDLTALTQADQVLEVLEQQLKGTSAGWHEDNHNTLPRRQNPHMHLFEAFLTLYEVTLDAKWLAHAGEIYGLFETVFFDSSSGVLLEYFDLHWRPCHEKGSIIEPGHMLEWVWLLIQYQKFTQKPVANYVSQLYNNALSLGLNKKTGLLQDWIDTSNGKLSNTHRCWPLTEWLKASLAMAQCTPENHTLLTDARQAINTILTHFKNPNVPSLHYDQVDANGNVICNYAPASTLYHLLMAHSQCLSYLNEPSR